jgi:hypothetical protein
MSDSSQVEQVRPRPRRPWLLWLVLAVVVGVAVAGLTEALLPPAKHTVRTLLRVPDSHFHFKPAEAIPDLQSHQRIQVAMVKSRLVLRSALGDPDVAQLKLVAAQLEPVEWLEKVVRVDFSVAPEILRISMSGDTTDELVVLVNAITKAYLREVVDRERAPRRERLARLGELREKFEGQLRACREIQKEIEAKLGAKDANARARMHAFVQQQLGMIERELLQTRLALGKARAELAVLEAQEKEFNSLVISKYRTRLASQEKTLAEEEKKARPDVVRQVRGRAPADLLCRINSERGRVASLEATEKKLEPEVKRLQARVGEVAKQGDRQDAFNEDMTQLVEMTRTIGAEEQALKVELEVPSRVSVLEEATVVGVQQSWRPFVPALAGLGGFLFVCCCVAVRLSLR